MNGGSAASGTRRVRAEKEEQELDDEGSEEDELEQFQPTHIRLQRSGQPAPPNPMRSPRRPQGIAARSVLSQGFQLIKIWSFHLTGIDMKRQKSIILKFKRQNAVCWCVFDDTAASCPISAASWVLSFRSNKMRRVETKVDNRPLKNSVWLCKRKNTENCRNWEVVLTENHFCCSWERRRF